MLELESYVGGKWERGKGKGATLVNPATGEALATTSTEGIDFQAALAFTRVGGRELRARTFSQRGERLRARSRAIPAHRDELILLAIANGGNTLRDAKSDFADGSGRLDPPAAIARRRRG